MLADIYTESLTELLAQIHYGHPSSPAAARNDLPIGRGDIVEIQGGPSSGKTHLLFHLVMNCITPSEYTGWTDVAIIFDMDHSFDTIRLNHLLLHRLTQSTGLDMSAAEFVAKQSLKRLHIFRPFSTMQLAATLMHLATHHSSHFPREKIGIVAIDSASSRYWTDRFVVEQMKNPLTSHPGPKHISHLGHVLLALESISRTHQPLVIMTNWGLHPLDNGIPSLFRQHLQPFPTLPGLRLAQSDRRAEKNSQYSYSENMPSLTAHITLGSIDTSVQYRSSETQDGPVQFAVLLRKSNPSSIDKFVLSISDEDISFKN